MCNFDELFYLVWIGVAVIFFIVISIYQSVCKYFNKRRNGYYESLYHDSLEVFFQSIAFSIIWPLTLIIGTAFVTWKVIGYSINWILTTYDRLHQEGD